MKNEWPKKIVGDRNHICVIALLQKEAYQHENKIEELKSGPESQFLGWLSEWYPELFVEFNKVLSGKKKWNDLPKYDLNIN